MPCKLPLVLMPQADGGYTVTSPLLPELVTEGDSLGDALDNVKDALAAVAELYDELGRPLPLSTCLPPSEEPMRLETVVAVP